jgi:hypothetical protein
MTLAELAAATVREGCVWETIAALEAQICAAEATDSEVTAVLQTVAADEARHAELAWDIVRWALGAGDARVATAVGAAFDQALEAVAAQVAAAATVADGAGLADLPAGFGALGAQRQARVRAHAVAAVLLPARQRWLGATAAAIVA